MADDIEADRLAMLRERAVEGDIRGERYGPGTFGCHEAMHVASMMADVVGSRLCEHPAVLLRADWYRLAAAAHEALFELYQAIGQDHMDAEPDAPTQRPEPVSQRSPPPSASP